MASPDTSGKTLAQLEIGDTATVRSVGGEGALRQHFLDMGVIPGAQMTLVKFAPLGDPMEFLIHGYELTLRKDDAAQITVEPSAQRHEQEANGAKRRPADAFT